MGYSNPEESNTNLVLIACVMWSQGLSVVEASLWSQARTRRDAQVCLATSAHGAPAQLVWKISLHFQRPDFSLCFVLDSAVMAGHKMFSPNLVNRFISWCSQTSSTSLFLCH